MKNAIHYGLYFFSNFVLIQMNKLVNMILFRISLVTVIREKIKLKKLTKIEEFELGKFIHIMDPEGNKN